MRTRDGGFKPDIIPTFADHRIIKSAYPSRESRAYAHAIRDIGSSAGGTMC
jgi:hypothetical protein